MPHYVNNFLCLWRFIIVGSIAVSHGSLNADTLFSADDPRINYYGRFDFSDPSAPRWNWSGSTIETCFAGPSIGIRLIDGKADYDVEIDGVVDTVIRTVDDVERYDINGLSEAMHTIRIIQRSENHSFAATFRGFYLIDGKSLGGAPTKPSRKIEFIGNSDLVAYGVESGFSKCSDKQVRFYTNTNRSYAKLVAAAFNAQSVILGWSGKGLVRNYDSPSKRSETSFPAYYDKTLGLVDGLWDFSKWIPDLVVIALGWNDFSSSSPAPGKYPDDTMFIGDYHRFIARIRGHYPQASILCVSAHNGNLVDYIKQVVAQENDSLRNTRVYYAEYPPDNSFTLTGCNGHPSPHDHRLIADAIIDTVRKRLGWDTAKTATLERKEYRWKKTAVTENSISFHFSNNKILISNDCTTLFETDILFQSIDGRTVLKNRIYGNKRALVTTTYLPSGVYLVGNRTAGFKRIAIFQDLSIMK